MDQSEKEIQQCLNKSYEYGGKVITIIGYEIDEKRDRVYIHTNEKHRHIDRPLVDAIFFVKGLKPAGNALIVNNPEVKNSVTTMDFSTADYLEEVLKKSIEKLQNDESYIKQATAINNNVNSLISITKLKMDYVKIMNRR